MSERQPALEEALDEQSIQAAGLRALEEVERAQDAEALERVRVQVLGKKGSLTRLLRSMGQLPPERRPAIGQVVNEWRDRIEAAIAGRMAQLRQLEQERRLEAERVDISLPGRRPPVGGLHPLNRTLADIKRIFIGLGFEVVTGPEVELDRYNFEMLNIPKDHPARDMQDTFWISEEILLRTHTSPVQVRTMERRSPPVRIIVPGKVYRCDADVTHSPMFHQVEGLLVDRGISFADLKGTLAAFAQELFGDRPVRFRPSYFPFTEPSAEMDVQCIICGGSGCRVCGGEGWLEILGSGMVHPEVLRGVGYDVEFVSGFAFGMGVERIAMLRHGIDDIRLLFENDLRFLRQF